jgi:xylulose-5-phosphate/fructose-6-phosphate phosphoketolase
MRDRSISMPTQTPFDMRVQNDLDRFHFVMDVIDWLPDLGTRGAYLKRKAS